MRNRIPWVAIAFAVLAGSCALSMVVAVVLATVFAFSESVLLGLLLAPWTVLLPIVLGATIIDVFWDLTE